MPSQNKLVQRLKVAILPLDLPCPGPVTHSGEILTTGKSHGKKQDRFFLIIIIIPSKYMLPKYVSANTWFSTVTMNSSPNVINRH